MSTNHITTAAIAFVTMNNDINNNYYKSMTNKEIINNNNNNRSIKKTGCGNDSKYFSKKVISGNTLWTMTILITTTATQQRQDENGKNLQKMSNLFRLYTLMSQSLFNHFIFRISVFAKIIFKVSKMYLKSQQD